VCHTRIGQQSGTSTVTELELLIEHERSANSEDSGRLAALNVLAQLQLKLVLEKRAATPDKQVDPKVPAH
jgi:hypothetical protein